MKIPTLMVLDDDIHMAALVSEMAKKIGFESSTTNTVDNLLIATADNDYDVIVLDLCIPDKDGIELIDLLAKNKNNSDLVIMSGYGRRLLEGAQFLAELKELNVLGILSKPFGIDELSTVLKTSLSTEYLS